MTIYKDCAKNTTSTLKIEPRSIDYQSSGRYFRYA